jgi:ribose 5-phosphate isomerase A
MSVAAMKRAVAARAVAEIRDGMIVGLGSGTTASMAVEALGVRVAQGLKIRGLPTSEKIAALARSLAIPLTSFAEHRRVDLDIDGADAIEQKNFVLVKGGGGSLLREKIVASASRRVIVIIDETKLVDRLAPAIVPVEIAPFGCEATLDHLAASGAEPRLRGDGERPFVSDNGNLIADCRFAAIDDAAALEARLRRIAGVLETGLFVGLATEIFVGRADGVEVIAR